MYFFTVITIAQFYSLSLHDALPISSAIRTTTSITSRWPSSNCAKTTSAARKAPCAKVLSEFPAQEKSAGRSEEHTSELQSLRHLVCRLLLEKKNQDFGTPPLPDPLQ